MVSQYHQILLVVAFWTPRQFLNGIPGILPIGIDVKTLLVSAEFLTFIVYWSWDHHFPYQKYSEMGQTHRSFPIFPCLSWCRIWYDTEKGQMERSLEEVFRMQGWSFQIGIDNSCTCSWNVYSWFLYQLHINITLIYQLVILKVAELNLSSDTNL